MCGVVDTWHDVSKPFVDTSLGRMAVNVATGGMSAPAFAAYDISNGGNVGRAALGGALGYFGGQAVNPGGIDSLGSMMSGGASSAPLAGGMGEMMGDYVPTGAEASMGSMAGTAPAYADILPMENSVGASMDTTGLSNINPSTGGGMMDRFLGGARAAMKDSWSAEGMGRTLGRVGPLGVGASLVDMYMKNEQGKKQRALFDQTQNSVNGMYAPGSPEYNALWQQMSRTDAAAGRNSQLGNRSVDLAAKIAQLKAGMLGNTLTPQYNMYNSSLSNGMGGLASLFANTQKANTPRPSVMDTSNQ